MSPPFPFFTLFIYRMRKTGTDFSTPPLSAHFLDTIKGVATIRAYGWTKTEVDNNYALLDTSQRPAYLLAMAQQWLALTLDIVVAILAIMVTVMAIKLRGNSGLAGASLVTLMTFGKNMAAIVRSYTEVETSIGAVSRLKSFNTVTPQERNTGQEFEPEQSWPRRGEVDMIDVSATYR